jgi:2-polyprenyl-3-methyl-5-hydroxy-6-metoxy-1,4-benzoquinol methylase
MQTPDETDVFHCGECGVMWHGYHLPANWYTSALYRETLEGDNSVENYYRIHDRDVVQKLSWTGTDIYRGNIVADIGAGGGSFLDFLLGVAKQTIAVEPNENYRAVMSKKGHAVYDYASSALQYIIKPSWGGGINPPDIITSFDVIEHVDDPLQFLRELHEWLASDGKVIIGTTNGHELLRKFAPDYVPFFFQVSHPWMFTEKSLGKLVADVGFCDVRIEQKYRYGFGNFINWITEGKPRGHIRFPEFSDTLDVVFKQEMIAHGLADVLLVTAQKK